MDISYENSDACDSIRKGTVWTAAAHIITAVIGAGILSLAWSIAQLGWIAGLATVLAFALVTYFTSCLLADFYRSPDPVTGNRSFTYRDAVKVTLGKRQEWLCGLFQYVFLYGVCVAFTITASISMAAIRRSNCFHKEGHSSPCHFSEYPFMILFGAIGIIFSQIPDFGKTRWLSIVAATMSFSYATISLGLGFATVIGIAVPYSVSVLFFFFLSHLCCHALTACIVRTSNKLNSLLSYVCAMQCKNSYTHLIFFPNVTVLEYSGVAENGRFHGSLEGISSSRTITKAQKAWRVFQALGDIAFAYPYSMILIEIEDTLKSPPPENKTMKKASLLAVTTTSIFYMLCGCFGYAAFGENAPGNLLTGFGFYEPYWLIDFADACVAIHLVGAYQVCGQPVFAFIERWFSVKWPNNGFINNNYKMHIPCYGLCNLNLFRLCWRSAFVVSTTSISILFPLFNDVLGILGAMTFWPLTVYFPLAMYIARNKVQCWTSKWISLQTFSFICFLVSVAAAVGSMAGILRGE